MAREKVTEPKQLDVFEVLELVEKEGLVPGKPDLAEQAAAELRSNVSRSKNPERTWWFVCSVEDDEAGQVTIHEFPSQVECWAFIKGYDAAVRART